MYKPEEKYLAKEWILGNLSVEEYFKMPVFKYIHEAKDYLKDKYIAENNHMDYENVPMEGGI